MLKRAPPQPVIEEAGRSEGRRKDWLRGSSTPSLGMLVLFCSHRDSNPFLAMKSRGHGCWNKACAESLRDDNYSMDSVAILGASNDRAKFGNKAVRAFQQKGYTVYPVNPKETLIESMPVFKSVLEVPARPDMVSVYLPPPILLKVLPDIAARGCNELWLNPGTESDEVLAAAKKLGLNVIQAYSIVGIGVSPGTL
jgi:predicted CoA-binding protein